VRVRVDVDEGVVAVLTTFDPGHGDAQPVEVIERVVMPFADGWSPTRLVHVFGPSPLAFVAGPTAETPDGHHAHEQGER
jgi:hypothetical protein